MAASFTTSATREEPQAAVPPMPSLPNADMAEIFSSLQSQTKCLGLQFRLYNGCWLPERFTSIIPDIHARFRPRPSDIIVASYPKSGTTWLKALAFATLNRVTHSPFSNEHPLRHCNPHDCVRFIELDLQFKSDIEKDAILDKFQSLCSPRLLATHLPYCLLPQAMAGEVPGCRFVYICRDPKDVLVSDWFFFRKLPSPHVVDGHLYTIHEAFENFCEGCSFFGPYWKHVLQYWERSSRSPDKVLFLKYEEMLRDPISNLKNLAEFMGCPFSRDEEEGGVIDAIVELCSLKELKSMEINKHGYNSLALKNETYFRKGEIGDWRNHLTPDMAERVDMIVEEAFQGSGLSFADSLTSE